MKLLAIDTSTQITEVTVYDTDSKQHSTIPRSSFPHSDHILFQIDTCLKQQGWNLSDIQAIICGAGPGSFTGLRIGISTAKALCFSLDISLVMVSSLDALVFGVDKNVIAFACTKASRDTVYAKLYSSFRPDEISDEIWQKLNQENVWEPAVLEEVLIPFEDGIVLYGDGPSIWPSLYHPHRISYPSSTPEGIHLAQLGYSYVKQGISHDIDKAVPSYIAPSAAEKKQGSA